MLIDSTLHVHKSIMEMLEKCSETTGESIHYMIKLLMQRVMKDNHRLLKTSSRIKYQKRDEKENWHRIHVVLNEYEYEYYLDMRKFYKMSVSFILAYAVRRYLDNIMNELLNANKFDNYLYRNYIFSLEVVDKIVCWKIYWGIPLKIPAF